MSKKSIGVPLNSTAMDGRIIYDYQIGSLEGKLLTFIESLGLRDSQEKSAKEIFKEIYYRQMYFETEYVGGEQLNKAREDWLSVNGQSGARIGRNN